MLGIILCGMWLIFLFSDINKDAGNGTLMFDAVMACLGALIAGAEFGRWYWEEKHK